MQPRITITGRAVRNAEARIEPGSGPNCPRAWVEVMLKTDAASRVTFRAARLVGQGPAAHIAACSMAHHIRAGCLVTVTGAGVTTSRKTGAQIDVQDVSSIVNNSIEQREAA